MLTIQEPVLTQEDVAKWEAWRRACLMHAKSRAHARMVDKARRYLHDVLELEPLARISWSAGKDSTALVHLAIHEGAQGRVFSIKDDLDYPGEREYVERWAATWGVSDRLDVVTPDVSLWDLLVSMAARHDIRDDLHSRMSEFSRQGFYDVIDRYNATSPIKATLLGLRAEESRGRRANRMFRGHLYQKQDGELIGQPLCDWRGIDVYAYLFSHDVELLPVYRCVRMVERPDQIRKSWWVPGCHGALGSTVWLKVYYPSLYQQLLKVYPELSSEA